MERREADRLNNRFPQTALMAVLFPFFSLVGNMVRILVSLAGAGGGTEGGPFGNNVGGDVLFLICNIGLVACGMLSFRGRKHITAEERQ